ncbi:MAG: phenylalanine--tRNA ligase subunit beta [Candidatus Hodarchaeales archaeon]|jgi:phenylalanyl-tRNA synthetase beta chain
MPTFEFDRDDFCELVGKHYGISELQGRLPMMGIPDTEALEGGDIFKVEVAPNRPDMVCVEGLARAFASFERVKIGLRPYNAETSDLELHVDPSVKDVRPFICCAVVENVSLSDDAIVSLFNVQEKLHTTHCRDRRKGSIGVYDANGLEFPLQYRAVDLDEVKFVPLEETVEMTPSEILTDTPKGAAYAHLVEAKAPLLTDKNGRVLSFPPIINSDDTKVTEKTNTVIIDVTGLDLNTASQALNIIVCALADRGGLIREVTVRYPHAVNKKKVHKNPDLVVKQMSLPLDYVNKRTGESLTADQVKEHLECMGFGCTTKEAGELIVSIPPYRTDILHMIDFVEDIMISFGFENVTPELPNLATVAQENPLETITRRLTYLLVGFGAQELMTYILTSPDVNFTKMSLPVDLASVAVMENPQTNRFTMCRSWMAPSILEALSQNTGEGYPQRVFEIGDCVALDSTSDTGTRDDRTLCYAEADAKTGWNGIKGILEALDVHLEGVSFELEPSSHPSFIPGRVAKIFVEGQEKGILGEIHPRVLRNWGISVPASLLELKIGFLVPSI